MLGGWPGGADIGDVVVSRIEEHVACRVESFIGRRVIDGAAVLKAVGVITGITPGGAHIRSDTTGKGTIQAAAVDAIDRIVLSFGFGQRTSWLSEACTYASGDVIVVFRPSARSGSIPSIRRGDPEFDARSFDEVGRDIEAIGVGRRGAVAVGGTDSLTVGRSAVAEQVRVGEAYEAQAAIAE